MGVAYEPGPEPDEGGIRVAANERISFDHIEAITVEEALCALIVGTTGDDDITVIARDDSTHAGTDGIRDFTTSLNAGPEILWINTPNLYIDALAGDDDIVVRAPAPNDFHWDVDVYVAGGAPAAGPALSEGDRLLLETPTAEQIVYTPTGIDTGTLLIDEDGDGSNTGTDSLITIGQFTVLCPDLAYTSDPGGIELLVYDGGSTDDILTVVGSTDDELFQHTPGALPDAGRVDIVNVDSGDSLLGINYENLWLNDPAEVVIDGAGGTDVLVALGTNGSDVIDVEFSAADEILVELTSSIGAHVPLTSV